MHATMMSLSSSSITKPFISNCKPYTIRSHRHTNILFNSPHRSNTHIATSSATGATTPEDDNSSSIVNPSTQSQPEPGFLGWWKSQQQKSAELRKKLVSLGPAAVLAYGMFDGVSYTIAFAIAFLGYEARTGLNPTANVADIIKICILMWAGNNVTRPFRLAGAAMLAPFMDRVMLKLQEKLRLPNKLIAFFMIVAVVASICLGIVGSLFLSRWVQG